MVMGGKCPSTNVLYLASKQVIEGKIEVRLEVTGGRGRRRKQLLDDLMERRGGWKLKEKVLARMLRRSRFGRGC
jgi:hypothetical protein